MFLFPTNLSNTLLKGNDFSPRQKILGFISKSEDSVSEWKKLRKRYQGWYGIHKTQGTGIKYGREYTKLREKVSSMVWKTHIHKTITSPH